MTSHRKELNEQFTSEDGTEDDWSPRERYQAFGAYDSSSLDDDYARWPSQFDDNYWPLFGDYDPYVLTHPLTGQPWYEAPRLTELEGDTAEYNYWLWLALEYDNSMHALRDVLEIKKSVPLAEPEPDALYFPNAKEAAAGNLVYLRKHVLPRLKELLHVRDASPEFAMLWGEFRYITGTLPTSAKEARNRHVRGKKSSEENKSAQLKWYLHWRRYHCDELRLSVKKANEAFSTLARDVATGKRLAPVGFDKSWFQKAVATIERNGDVQYLRSLPETLRRWNEHPRAKQLLADLADAEPRIPPLTIDAYRKAE